MTSDLIKSEPQSFNDLMNMSKLFAESGMFENMKQAAQCFVKIQAGQEIGIPPFQAMSGIHIIKGKPTIGAGLIASKIKGSGKYDYRIIQQDEKACSIDFFQGKEKIGNSTFTTGDAQKAGTQNMDKHPRNMLFARAISNGVKWFCPDVFTGPVYVPEEMEDIPHQVMSTTIGQPDPSQPQMTDEDSKYRTPTNDRSVIEQLIDNATSATLLRTFAAVNTKAFKEHTDLYDKLKAKGLELAPKQNAA